jgi:signal transduction histidine kinase/CheY-like chemotaxis protein
MSPEQFLQVADLYPEPSILLTAGGQVVAANRAAAALLPEGLAGRALADCASTPAATVRDYLERCSRSREPVVGTLGLRDRAGGAVTYRCHGAACRDPGGADTDILLRLDREGNATPPELGGLEGDFLDLLGHELRNLLTPIGYALHALKPPGADAATTRRAREVMERQVGRMARLADDLLDVSRLGRGKIELRREPVELAAVVARALDACRPCVEAEGHELTVEVPPEPLWVDGDPARLSQIVTSLLDNAAKYTERGGGISLTAGREGGDAVLRVRDSGVGIAPEHLPRLFDVFYPAGRRTKESRGGPGLALVRGLVELHGGTAEAHSDGPGKGSVVVVRLPLREGGGKKDAGRTPAAKEAGAKPAGRRILVVDDNVDAADGLAMLLRLEGHDVAVAYDGVSALAVAEADPPALAVLDLGMPMMDGYELARAFRARPALRGVVLVALTGLAQPEDRQRTQEAGFDHHLVKPVDADELQRLFGGRE